MKEVDFLKTAKKILLWSAWLFVAVLFLKGCSISNCKENPNDNSCKDINFNLHLGNK